MSQSTMIILFCILFVISIIYSRIRNYYREKHLAQKFQDEVMADLGGIYVRSQNPNQISHDLASLLRWCIGEKGTLKNVVKKQIEGVEILLFTYTYSRRTGRGKNSHKKYKIINHTVAAISTEPGQLPEFFIRPEGVFDGFQKAMGKNYLELPAAHSLAVQVYGEDEHNPLVFKNIPEEAWTILRRYNLSTAHRGNWFLLYQYDDLEDNPQTYQQYFELAEKFYRYFLR